MCVIWSFVHICVIPPDQIALPDLGPVAMENWGLITYEEGALLYEEGVSSLLHKEAISSLIAHELAHQVCEKKKQNSLRACNKMIRDELDLCIAAPTVLSNSKWFWIRSSSILQHFIKVLHDTVTSTIHVSFCWQWFGNLVTMKWWNEIWLNEGFATYMSYFAVDHVEPTFKMVSSVTFTAVAEFSCLMRVLLWRITAGS